jgi:hypothetical protein
MILLAEYPESHIKDEGNIILVYKVHAEPGQLSH